jgi:translation elongation factor EF-G
MSYDLSDINQSIATLVSKAPTDSQEYLPASASEINELLQQSTTHSTCDKTLLKQLLTGSGSATLQHALEDLLDLLIEKQVIIFTELSSAAQAVLSGRRHRDLIADQQQGSETDKANNGSILEDYKQTLL